ncbi:MAG: CsbD family protein [Gammaproteobacteria bacterium]|nr:CsbD family protein [Gammaproteobacteria bacterium]
MKKSSDRTEQPVHGNSPAQNPSAPTTYSVDPTQRPPRGYDVIRPPQPLPAELQPTPQQQQQGIPSADELKGKWKQHVGAAKIVWGKLTEDELLKLEGRQEKLAGLVQERYAITRDEAEKQVKAFYERNKI